VGVKALPGGGDVQAVVWEEEARGQR